MNNHADAKSVVNAIQLKAFLGEAIEGDFNPQLLKRYPVLKEIVPATRSTDLLTSVRPA